MLQSLRRMRENEEGFTLIELMVVVLIIAILIAIAIPTFLGAQDRARDRAAQSDLRNALTAAKSIGSDFEGAWQAEQLPAGTDCSDDGTEMIVALEEENASLAYAAGPAASETELSVTIEDDTTSPGGCELLLLQRTSTSGKHYCMAAHQNGNTFRSFKDKPESGAPEPFTDYADCVDGAPDTAPEEGTYETW